MTTPLPKPAKPRGVSRVTGLRAFRAGQAAKASGREVTAVPYDVSGDAGEQFKAKFWIRGWRTPIV